MKFENIIKTLQKLDYNEAFAYLVGVEELTKNDPKTNAAIKGLILDLIEG